MKRFYISSVQYGSHEPQVAIEYLKHGYCDQETEF